jgi:hypothetical protein
MGGDCQTHGTCMSEVIVETLELVTMRARGTREGRKGTATLLCFGEDGVGGQRYQGRET